MKIQKTDRRFNLFNHGFTHYVEYHVDNWNEYNRVLHFCRKQLGDEFWYFNNSVYQKGNWKAVPYYRNRKSESKRVYFRGEKFITMMSLAMPSSPNTFFVG